MANPNWKKGVSGNPKGKPVGIKNRATLIMEERRAIFEQKASEMWEDTISQLPATYIADQFMGKAPDKFEHSGKIQTEDLTAEVLAEVKARKKQKLANAES